MKWPIDVEFDEHGRVPMEVDPPTADVINLISSEDETPPEQSTTTTTLRRNPRRDIGKGKGKEKAPTPIEISDAESDAIIVDPESD